MLLGRLSTHIVLGMERTQLLQQIATMRQALFDKGILDKHFTYLENLDENGNPNFVEDTTGLFFRDSANMLATLQRTFVGAIRVKNEVNRTREYCEQGNLEAAKAAFQQLRNEHNILGLGLILTYRY
ncbi:pseudo histidine-containing phosphotransfer protein 5-like [Pistacia vera]|uniref:pseudo histidine-containing phosphotransfer protein 5-like n=1 Tax=Pistacia vera TaxID=55513 RepID=UPI001263AD71|nr:pseudo histidine-containing phosphotransfer protein 5-like [Pistacia vera]